MKYRFGFSALCSERDSFLPGSRRQCDSTRFHSRAARHVVARSFCKRCSPEPGFTFLSLTRFYVFLPHFPSLLTLRRSSIRYISRIDFDETKYFIFCQRIHCRRICVSLIISAMRVDRWTVVKILNGYRWKKWEKWKARFPSINKFHIYRVYSI